MPDAASLAEGVASVVGTENAFAAVKTDGSVVTWGDAENGGDSSGHDSSTLSQVVADANRQLGLPATGTLAKGKHSSCVNLD